VSKRDELELALAKIVGKALAKQLIKIRGLVGIELLLNDEFWVGEDEIFRTTLTPSLVEIAQLGAVEAAGLLKVAVDTGYINVEAIEWARSYGFDLVKGINTTSRAVIERGLTYYIGTPGATLQDFVDVVSPSFGPVRADMIAVTETTRAYAEGGDIAVRDIRNQGMEIVEVFQSQNAPNTCDACMALHGKRRGDGWTELPPLHVGCNCWATYEIV